MSKSTTKESGRRSAQIKNGQRKGSEMELFLTSMYVLCLCTCMFRELATSGKKSGMIKEKLSDEVLNG